MCNPLALGLGSFAQGAFGALQGASQARARNRAAIQSYEHALNVRKSEWYQQLSVWGAKRNQYFQDINENDLAAQRGYAQAQVGLNRVWEGAMQSNEQALIKYLQNHGKYAAAGRTGRSIDRLGTLEKGQLERHAGKQLFALTRAKHSHKQNVEDIRNQQISHRNKLQANVTFAPMPDLAPPPPQMENESAMPGLLMAVGSGLMSYGMAGGRFGKGAKVGANAKVTTGPGSTFATSPNQPWLSNSAMQTRGGFKFSDWKNSFAGGLGGGYLGSNASSLLYQHSPQQPSWGVGFERQWNTTWDEGRHGFNPWGN